MTTTTTQGAPSIPERTTTTTADVVTYDCPNPPQGAGARDSGLVGAFCATRFRIADLLETLDYPVPTFADLETSLDLFCAGESVPDRNDLEVGWGAYIKGSSQGDPDLGERWLREGILTKYERTNTGPNSWTLDFEFNRAVINRLVEADLAFLAELVAHQTAWCDDA